jgi:hypothetical protein
MDEQQHLADRQHMEADVRFFVQFMAIATAGACTIVLVAVTKWLS